MQQTTNYQLPQWEAGDQVKREDFNGAMSKIDTALKAVAGGVRIERGSYKGIGKVGPNRPNSLTFSFDPVAILIVDTTVSNMFNPSGIGGQVWFRDDSCGATGREPNLLFWGDRTLTWYATDKGTAEDQLDFSGSTYRYIAIGLGD